MASFQLIVTLTEEDLEDTIKYLTSLLNDVKYEKQCKFVDSHREKSTKKWFKLANEYMKDNNISDAGEALYQTFSQLSSDDKWANVGKSVMRNSNSCNNVVCQRKLNQDNSDIYVFVFDSCYNCCEVCYNNGQGWALEFIEKQAHPDVSYYYQDYVEWNRQESKSYEN